MLRRPAFIVSPASEYWKRILLFSLIGRALGVLFIPEGDSGTSIADARISFFENGDGQSENTIPNLKIVSPHYKLSARNIKINLSGSQLLFPPLRGSSFMERHSWSPVGLSVKEGDIILAESGGRPIWLRKRGREIITEVVSTHLEELAKNEILIDRWREENMFSLLPILHFVRSVLLLDGFVPPPPRATFIIDDLNLRAFSYGCVDIPSMIQLAESYNFHIVLATIPLDLQWSSKIITQFVQRRNKQISLAIHGNNHVRREFNRGKSQKSQLKSMAQALRRTEHFEKRYGLQISRIVIPPYGIYSHKSIKASRSLGVEAVCVSHPMPWSPSNKVAKVSPENRLQRWFPADFVEGMPILHRSKTTQNNSLDLFLGQPLITYFHHNDFIEGYDRICNIAKSINRLDDIHWCSLQEIGESNYEARCEGNTMRIRAFARKLNIVIPDGINQLLVELPDTANIVSGTTLNANGKAYEMNFKEDNYESPPISVNEKSIFSIRFIDPLPKDPRNIREPPISISPFIHRVLSEARDRISPLVYRIHKRR